MLDVYGFSNVVYYSYKSWKYTCDEALVHVSSRLEINNCIYSDILQEQFYEYCQDSSLPTFVSNI